LPSQGKFWPAITRQQIELESCSNPLKTRDVLLFRINSFFKIWVLGPWDHDLGVLRLFWWRHHPIQRADIVGQRFLDARLEYESLELLIEFLAFLVQKLCQKIQTFPEVPRGFP